MQLPRQTAEIFEKLSKGGFICSNGDDKDHLLYTAIDGEHFELLCEYFAVIGFVLERGDEYFYFSRTESRADLERKLEAALKWIDVLDFLKTYDISFGRGFRFSAHEVLTRISVDAALKAKLEGLKKHALGKERHADILQKIIELLERDTFVILDEPISSTYKALTSFHYLEELVMTINIPEEVSDEIPE